MPQSSAQKPWEVKGISRSTHFRRLRAAKKASKMRSRRAASSPTTTSTKPFVPLHERASAARRARGTSAAKLSEQALPDAVRAATGHVVATPLSDSELAARVNRAVEDALTSELGAAFHGLLQRSGDIDEIVRLDLTTRSLMALYHLIKRSKIS